MNLTLQNCTEFVHSNGPEAVREAVKELYRTEDAAKIALSEKVKAYFASKDERYKRIVEQIEKVQEQRQAVEAEKGKYDRSLVEATIRGDGETVEAVQKELERCASAIAAYDAQIEVFKAYELRGDEAIAAEIARDHTALLDLIEGNKAIREAMFQITEEIKRAWASAIYNPDVKRVTGYREPWMDDFDRVQKDQQKAPATVGAMLDAAAAVDAKTAAARQQGAAAPRAVFPGH